MRLSRLREEHGRSLEDLARFLRVALPQASRLDTGARGFPSRQVAQLADWYGVADGGRAELLDLAAESRKRAWWQQIDLPDSYRTLIGMEQAATSIKEYGNWVVPGLLQTADYARASATGSVFDIDPAPEAVEQAAQLRTRRQQVLYRPKPPLLRVVIDEAVLARTVGGQWVMAAQLGHLEEMSERSNVSIRVIDFRAGAYPGGSRGHYILLKLGPDLPDLLYREGLGAPGDTSDPVIVDNYWEAWRRVSIKALDEFASRELIRRYRSTLDPR